MHPSASSTSTSNRLHLSEMSPLLGHGSTYRTRSRIVMLCASAVLAALIIVAATNSDAAAAYPFALKSTHGSPSVQSEDRFVSTRNPYIAAMNGHGGISFFDPRLSISSASPAFCIVRQICPLRIAFAYPRPQFERRSRALCASGCASAVQRAQRRPRSSCTQRFVSPSPPPPPPHFPLFSQKPSC